jgi:YfiH family protein
MLNKATRAALARIPRLVQGFGLRAPGRSPESPAETARRVAAGLDGDGRLLLLRQVHGTTVALAPWDAAPQADAAVATEPGLVLGIQTADCLPVLLVDPERGFVAAAHAGWRGTAAGVTRQAVRALIARGSRPEALVAALGPGIGPCCYEVGDELRELFGPEAARFFLPGTDGGLRLDVRAANVRQLEAAGVRPEAIHHVADCTFCHAGRYHSYRREGHGSGRMISFVGFRQRRSAEGSFPLPRRNDAF